MEYINTIKKYENIIDEFDNNKIETNKQIKKLQTKVN